VPRVLASVDAPAIVFPRYPPMPYTYTSPFYITSTAFFLVDSEVPKPIEWSVFPPALTPNSPPVPLLFETLY